MQSSMQTTMQILDKKYKLFPIKEVKNPAIASMATTMMGDGKLKDNLTKIDSRIEDLIKDQDSIRSMKDKFNMTAEKD